MTKPAATLLLVGLLVAVGLSLFPIIMLLLVRGLGLFLFPILAIGLVLLWVDGKEKKKARASRIQ